MSLVGLRREYDVTKDQWVYSVDDKDEPILIVSGAVPADEQKMIEKREIGIAWR